MTAKQARILILAAAFPACAFAQVYRCYTPSGTVYQARPCAVATQQKEIQDRLTVIPSNGSKARQQSTPRTSRTERTSRIETTADKSAQRQAAECSRLRNRIAQIDIRARQRSTASLTAERRKLRDRQYELKCSTF